MTRLTQLQTNFSSGELDPLLAGQANLKAYANGAKRVRNCARRSTGGMERRGGTYDLAALPARTRLAEFEFSDAQRYVIGFSAGAVRVFDLSGTLLQTLAAPWTEAQAFELAYTQLADTMVVMHQDVQTRLLKRTGLTTFALSLFAFDRASDDNLIWQPYYKFELPAVTLNPSAATGAITLTSSAALFSAAQIGTRFRIYDAEVEITGFTSSTVVSASVKGTLVGRLGLDPFRTQSDGGGKIEATHVFHGLATGVTVTFSGSNAIGGLAAVDINLPRLIDVVDDHRYFFFAAAGSTTSLDGGGPNVKFSTAGAATRNWKEPAFSAQRGWPGCGAFHEGRLWLGGTVSQPDGVFGSKALSPFNFDVGEGLDDESVQTAIGSEDISRVRHMMSNGELQMFTATSESVFITRQNEPITPGNARIKKQAGAGVGVVQPVVFDGATLFVQENGLGVSELVYSDATNGYVSTPVSTLAGHLVRTPVAAGASPGLTDRAEPTAYFANADGTVAVFHSMRQENIAGWGLWTLGAGLVRSVCAIGPYVYFCVEVRGAFRLYRLADNALVQLDGAVLHTAGAATTTWTLDARTRNRTVSVVSELGYHGEFEIGAGGALTLPVAVSNVVAGDAFYFLLETLPPTVALPQGERFGLKQRIVRAIVQLSSSLSVSVAGKRIETRFAGTDFAAAVTPLEGHYQVSLLGYSRDPTVVITQDEPLFARVLGVTLEVNV